jgi:hypothetical protein
VTIFGSIRNGSSAKVEADEVGAARIAAARGCSAWTELDGPLIARGPWWVDAQSDRLYTPFRGAVWEPGSASLVFAGTVPLAFTVHGGELTLFERVVSPASWSEVVAKRARRQARATS